MAYYTTLILPAGRLYVSGTDKPRDIPAPLAIAPGSRPLSIIRCKILTCMHIGSY